ncbi:MAG: MATE family efflux transporter [Lachnospiraceae bacterium]|nr:MATE family efflux transporter [Lachnospiraceae bacterium]
MFSKQDLKKLIIPLIVEQVLVVAVGMADTIMISSVGEAAVSGVSLVDTVNVLLINIFTALATGGAVVAGHCLGEGSKERASEAAEQLVLFTAAASVFIMLFVLIGHQWILTHVFGRIEADVMSDARTYLLITAFSIPFIAVYNAGAAIFRAMSDSRTSMLISLIMNGVNIAGNALLLYGLGMGVEGAAIPTLVSRILAAVIAIVLLRNQDTQIHLRKDMTFRFQKGIIHKICFVGIPNGLENSVFQLGKIMVLSLVTSFGTTALAANAVANNIAMFQIIPGMAIGYAIVTVVSQCVGAGRYDEAKRYTKLLLKYMYAGMCLVNIIVIFICPLIVRAYHLSQDTGELTTKILIYHAICCITIWSLAFGLPNTLRSSGDVKVTLVVSMVSMWIFRIGFSFLLGSRFHWGVFGIWVAMTIDWLFRAILFSLRYRSGKWENISF